MRKLKRVGRREKQGGDKKGGGDIRLNMEEEGAECKVVGC